MSIKGLLYFDLELKYWSRSYLLQSGAKILIKGLLYFNLELLKCWSMASLLWFGIEMLTKVISTSIWICWNGDQRSSLPQPGLLKCWSKIFSTSIWNCWNIDQRSSLLQSEIVEMSIKGLLYSNLELLKRRPKVFFTPIWIKCWSKVFSTPIWSCLN